VEEVEMLTRLYIKHFSEVKIAPADDEPPLVKEDEEYKYDPKKDPEKDLIVDELADQLHSIGADKVLQVKKLKYLVFCSISNVIGILFTIWGLSLTVLFDHYEKNLTVFYCSFVFYIPFLVWLKVLLFPDLEEYKKRQYVVEKRNWRERVNSTRFRRYMNWDEQQQGETPEEREKRLKEERAKALTLKIGKNVPKLGQIDSPTKKTDYSSIYTPKRALNIVIDRNGREIVRPPPIIPDQVLKTGTAKKLPDFTPNKYNRYTFVHPDPDGEAFGIQHFRQDIYTKDKRGATVSFDV
jgi:hypothetical protein